MILIVVNKWLRYLYKLNNWKKNNLYVIKKIKKSIKKINPINYVICGLIYKKNMDR